MNERTGPLAGLRIIEFAGIGPAPLAGQLLGDLGAEIIVIDRATEAIDKTDINRRNKSSIALNLKSAAAVDIALELIETADALIEGFRPGVMERLGLSPEICADRNPRLIYTRLTGWGQSGPLSHRAGHDLNYMSLAGALAAIGHSDRPPVPPLNLVGDYAAGSMFAIFGLLAAIVERQSSGRGQVVDAAMCDGVPALMGLFHTFLARGTWSQQREDNFLDGGAPYYCCYETKDQKIISVAALEPQFFTEFCKRAGINAGEQDTQYDKKNWPGLKETIAARICEKTRDEWVEIFNGSDACVAPVLTFNEMGRHPHNVARNIFQHVDGVLQAVSAPRFSRSIPKELQSPKAPGADTEHVLQKLGYSRSQIQTLWQESVLT